MMRGHTEISQGHAMLWRRITSVVMPAVARMLLRQIHHQSIAPDFGNDRSSGDRKAACITTDDTGCITRKTGRDAITVYQRVIRAVRQPRYGALHRQHRSVQNVKRVDFFDAGLRHRNFGAFPKDARNGQPAGMRQTFRIIQTLGDTVRIEPDCRGHDWTCQRPPADLVYANDIAAAQLKGGSFVDEIGQQV